MAVATTMNQLLERVGSEGDPGFYAGTSTTLGATSVTDTKLITAANMSRFTHGFITRTALDTADRHRFVSAYVGSTGVATVNTYSNTSPTTVACLWFTRWNPVDIEAAANRALERLEFPEEFDALVLADGQRQYDLTTDLAWVTRPGQVYAVLVRSGTTANQYTFRPLRGWRVTQDRDVWVLEFQQEVPGATDVIRICSWRPYSSLATHPIVTGAGASDISLDLWAFKTLYNLTEIALTGATLEGREQLERDLLRYSQRVSEQQAEHTPKIDSQSLFSSPRQSWGFNAVAGRRF